MKEIQLSKNGKYAGMYVALVDDEDYEYLNQWEWYISFEGRNTYARRDFMVGGKPSTVKIHRMIMNTPDDMVVDHIDHNGLNNQKSNLRNCTQRENLRNTEPIGVSGYMGVCLATRIKKYPHFVIDGPRHKRVAVGWEAKMKINGKYVHLGIFKDKRDAAFVYDMAVKKYHSNIQRLNFPDLFINGN